MTYGTNSGPWPPIMGRPLLYIRSWRILGIRRLFTWAMLTPLTLSATLSPTHWQVGLRRRLPSLLWRSNAYRP